MDYCQPIIQGSLEEGVNTYFYCDWDGVLYQSALECYSQCSQLLISRSDAQFIVLLVFSLFVLFVVVLFFKVVVD
jgi:hypothetical protein